MQAERILVVAQMDPYHLGRIGDVLEARGLDLHVVSPNRGEALPPEPSCYAAVVVLGGSMSANDDETLPGIRAQLDWIPGVLEAQVPFLGVCLGAQMLARVLGARVAPHPRGCAQVGYYALRATAEGRDLFGDGLHVYHWHREGFELPAGAVLLATGETFPNQAYRYGERAFGIQFHPEVTPDIIRKWTSDPGESLSRPGAQPVATQLEGAARHDRALGLWLEGFVDGWLAPGDRERSRAARGAARG